MIGLETENISPTNFGQSEIYKKIKIKNDPIFFSLRLQSFFQPMFLFFVFGQLPKNVATEIVTKLLRPESAPPTRTRRKPF